MPPAGEPLALGQVRAVAKRNRRTGPSETSRVTAEPHGASAAAGRISERPARSYPDWSLQSRYRRRPKAAQRFVYRLYRRML